MATSVFEVDCHVHAGAERRGVALQQFEAALRERGIRCAGLVDHAEFYIADKPRPFVEALRGAGCPYAENADGFVAFCGDVRALRASSDLRLACGLESEFIDRTPQDLLGPPDFVAHCFKVRGDGKDFGVEAAERIRRFAAWVRPSGKPAVVHHPFRCRVLAYRELLARGEAPAPERFITPDDVRRIADAVGEAGLFIEVNLSTVHSIGDSPEALALYVHAVRLLIAEGPRLTLGSDAHGTAGLALTAGMRRAVSETGLTPAHLQAACDRLFGGTCAA